MVSFLDQVKLKLKPKQISIKLLFTLIKKYINPLEQKGEKAKLRNGFK